MKKEQSLLDYWLTIYRYRFAIYIVVITSVAAAFFVSKLVPPVYEARASFYIPTSVGSISYLSSGATSTLTRQQSKPLDSEDDYKPYLGILKSRELAEMVHAQFPRESVGKLLLSDVDFELTDQLIVHVYARNHDPVLAANIANAYVNDLNKILGNASLANLAKQPEYIELSLAKIRAELREAESEQKRFEQKHHIASLHTELKALSNQKTSLQAARDDISSRITVNRAKRRALIAAFRREGVDLARSKVAVTSPVIEDLRKQLADVLSQLAESPAGPKNLQIIALLAHERSLKKQLSDQIRDWLSSQIKPTDSHIEALRQELIAAVIEYHELRAMLNANHRSLDEVNDRLRPYPGIKARWADLNQNTERLRLLEAQMKTNLIEAKLEVYGELRTVVPLGQAAPPETPAFPIWWLNVLIALLAGMLAGIGYAFFLNYLTQTRPVRTGRLVRTILRREKSVI